MQWAKKLNNRLAVYPAAAFMSFNISVCISIRVPHEKSGVALGRQHQTSS